MLSGSGGVGDGGDRGSGSYERYPPMGQGVVKLYDMGRLMYVICEVLPIHGIWLTWSRGAIRGD